jgi:hypothetical protein
MIRLVRWLDLSLQVFYFCRVLFVDWFFYDILLHLNCWELAVVNFFNFLLMSLAKSHDQGYKFVMLTRVDSRCFILSFYIYIYIYILFHHLTLSYLRIQLVIFLYWWTFFFCRSSITPHTFNASIIVSNVV